MWVTPNTVMTEVIFLSNVVDHCHGYLSLPSRVVVTIKATHVHTHTHRVPPLDHSCVVMTTQPIFYNLIQVVLP